MTHQTDKTCRHSVSFFERLQTDLKDTSLIEGPDPNHVLASIKRNISQILNARLRESLSAPALGLDDFNDAAMHSTDMAMHIRRAIHDCLMTYEPRLSELDIHILPDESTLLAMRFYLEAVVELGSLNHKVKIDVLLDTNKQYRVI